MAAAGAPPGDVPPNATIEFLVKNPSRPTLPDFRLAVPSAATVGDVKRRLQATYPGSPLPAAVTVSSARLRLASGPGRRVGAVQDLRRQP